MPADNICPTASASTDRASPSRHRRRDGGLSSSIFKNATNSHIENSSFTINNAQTQLTLMDGASDPLNKLYSQVATNAILNAGGRADEVRCHPGTREEIIGLIERWMESDVEGNSAPNMMWLSGPAGAGKSAIVQTIAERCKERGMLAANFFFFRADPTRSTAQSFVATLLYQIVKAFPTARQAIAAVLFDNPLVFGSSIQDQFNMLLLSPLRGIPPSLDSAARRPIVLLIDGLDECDSDHKVSQKHIIQALDNLLVQKIHPFLVLVASRAEPQISMAFNQLASPVQCIFLDDKYAPEKDIRIFVTAEFDKIKKSHNLAHMLGDSWPSAGDTEAIVRKSSGQFIFAGTVMRFLANSPASPMLSLERVQGIAPVAKNSPFSQLDAIYTYVLSQVDDQEAVKDLLAATLLHNMLKHDKRLQSLNPIRLPIKTMLGIYDPSRYGLALIDSCASELAALIQFKGNQLEFYHASFTDFLGDKPRSREYHIDIYGFGAKILPAIWTKAPESLASTVTGIGLLITLKKPTPEITTALRSVSSVSSGSSDFMLEYITSSSSCSMVFSSIHRLYYHDDIKSYKKILRQWALWYVSKPEGRDLTDLPRLPFVMTYIRIARVEFWFTDTIKAAFRVK